MRTDTAAPGKTPQPVLEIVDAGAAEVEARRLEGGCTGVFSEPAEFKPGMDTERAPPGDSRERVWR